MSKYLDTNGLLYFWGKLKLLLGGKVDKVTGKGLSTNDYTDTEKSKLSGIAAGANAYTHPSYTAKSAGLYKVAVDATGHVSAATAVAKSDITDLGIPGSSTTYSPATTSVPGLMSATDKSKLDSVAASANNYEHPTGDGSRHVPATGTTNSGKFLRAGAEAGSEAWGTLAKADVTGALGYTPPTTNTTYGAATGSAAGLMSATDKSKLDGVADGANAYVHPAHSAKSAGLYKVTVDAQGHVSAAAAVVKSDITGLGIPASDTTYAVMTAATSGAAGASGLVPAPAAGKQASYLRGDGTWVVPTNTTYSPATTGANGLMSAADKTKLDAFGAASTYALKSDIAAMYKYKGAVDTVTDLPTSGMVQNDVYDVRDSGMNYAWNGTVWDALGAIFSIDAVTNAEIDEVMAS